jgi:hypothetical protein
MRFVLTRSSTQPLLQMKFFLIVASAYSSVLAVTCVYSFSWLDPYTICWQESILAEVGVTITACQDCIHARVWHYTYVITYIHMYICKYTCIAYFIHIYACVHIQIQCKRIHHKKYTYTHVWIHTLHDTGISTLVCTHMYTYKYNVNVFITKDILTRMCGYIHYMTHVSAPWYVQWVSRHQSHGTLAFDVYIRHPRFIPVRMYVCMYVRMCVCAHVCKYVCMYICACIHIFMCTCMYVCMYVYVHVRISEHRCSMTLWAIHYLFCSFIHIYVHINIHILPCMCVHV